MVLLNNGEYTIATEAELEVLMANVDDMPATADEMIDAFLEIQAVELPAEA